MGEGEECNDPEQYGLENPATEEESDETECAPEDSECVPPEDTGEEDASDEEGTEGEENTEDSPDGAANENDAVEKTVKREKLNNLSSERERNKEGMIDVAIFG